MSSEPKSPPPPRKPLPSAEEIQAYVELSAARTKKRLTLASGNARPIGAAVTPVTTAKTDRKLPVGSAAAAPAAPAPAASTKEADAEAGAGWQPFPTDDKS
ncbi:MAG: hypothetical protein RL685_3363 [Pseudomonadota bacterium]|jgi:hypothetical protein